MTVDPLFDYQFRLILIGDSTVGKSSLLKYFTDGKFAEVSAHVLYLQIS
jgi:GTPase SAR1 and related small G proteins